MSPLALILTQTTISCLVVGLLGLLVVHQMRQRALRVTVIVAGLVPVLAVAVSVLINVKRMFLSTHDSFVVLVALGWAMVVAAGLTVVVGHSVSAGAMAIREGLERLSTSGSLGAHSHRSQDSAPGSAPAELAELVAELDLVQERLVLSRNRERALEQSRRELVAFMSHDLRTPLAGLRALAEGVEDGVVDDVPAAMTRIRGTVDRLSQLVNDLFELSRLTGGGTQRPRRLVSLAEVAMDVTTEAYDHARACGVRVLLELPGAEDRLPVLGDADELVRAMTNLVANAVRHTEPGGAVRVVGDRGPHGQIRMAVIDGCGGIPDSDLAHVFDVGWRGSPARTPDDGGAGLGLAIARGVVESHSGRLLVRNVDGGCRFELDLPLAAAP
jgi:signal transduction histidine kinase